MHSTIRLLRLSVPPEAPPVKVSRHQADHSAPRISLTSRLHIPFLLAVNLAEHSFQFLPGQWLDVFVPDPSIPKPGGFTITSPPAAAAKPGGYLELAIQKSRNPPAAWLWRPASSILNSTLTIRAGGSFHWPPPTLSSTELEGIERVVLVAGGVGINPFMSIISHFAETPALREKLELRLLYSVKEPAGGISELESILFLRRLAELFGPSGERFESKQLRQERVRGSLTLYLTNTESIGRDSIGFGPRAVGEGEVKVKRRRIGKSDVLDALGPVEGRKNIVFYVCGVPSMTDEFVRVAKEAEGMDPRRVLCEKWW